MHDLTQTQAIITAIASSLIEQVQYAGALASRRAPGTEL